MSDTQRDLDIVLLGATGFVGRLIAAHLVHHAPDGTRLAFAGRNRAKLDALADDLAPAAHDIELVQVDATDHRAVRDLVARTRVVASTVGPYIRGGLPLVRACAELGTHYADLTGEVLFVRASHDECHASALASGARIVHACGFDSVPSDLGVYLTARQAAEDDAGTLTDTVLYVRSLRGGISGGTIDSGRQQAIIAGQDPQAKRILADRHALSADRNGEPSAARRHTPSTGDTGSGLKARAGTVARAAVASSPVRRDARTGRWTAPFVMADFNTRIVRRSNSLLGWAYGRDFRYREVMDMGTGPTAPVMAAGMTAGLLGLLGALSFGPTRAVADRLLPKPGEGPSEQSRANGRYVMDIEACTSTGARYRTRFADEHDPGYDGTAILIGQAALALALDGDRLPEMAGVLTPATGIGEPLADRLREQGLTIETTRVG